MIKQKERNNIFCDFATNLLSPAHIEMCHLTRPDQSELTSFLRLCITLWVWHKKAQLTHDNRSFFSSASHRKMLFIYVGSCLTELMVFVYNKIGDTLNQRRSHVETTPLKSECMSQAYIYKSHTKTSAHWNIMWIKRLDLWYQRQKEEKNIKWPMTDDKQKQWIHKRVIGATKFKASDNMSNSEVYSSLFTTVIWD